MKKIIIALMVVASAMSMMATDAQAVRLGGMRTIGKQSPTVAKQAPMQAAAKPAAPAAAPPAAAPPSPWRGILGGALLGLGLGALLSHMGIGGDLASMISTFLMIMLLVLAVMFIYKMFKRKKETDMQPAAYAGSYSNGYAGSNTPEIGSRLDQQASYQPEPAYIPYGVPSDFDVPGFLRSAKTYFIRLQASWDKADVNDIREFTSPEMFAELKMQLQERGTTQNVTDVVTLEAELLGIENVGNDQMASVQFFGAIREGANAPAVDFAEVWNLTRPLSGPGGWVLAGIQHSS